VHVALELDDRALPAPGTRIPDTGSAPVRDSPLTLVRRNLAENSELRIALQSFANQVRAVGANIVWNSAHGRPDAHACLGLDAENDRCAVSAGSAFDARNKVDRAGVFANGRLGGHTAFGQRQDISINAVPMDHVIAGLASDPPHPAANGGLRSHSVVHQGAPHIIFLLRIVVDRGSVAVNFLVAGIDAIRARTEVAIALPMFEVCLKAWARSEGLIAHVQTLETALDCTVFGLFVLDEDRKVISVNRAGEDLLAARDGLRRIGASIGGETLSDTMRLQSAIEHAMTGLEHDDGAIVAMKRADRQRPLLVSVSAPTDKTMGSRRIAVLHVIDPERNWAPSLQPICRHYGLSPVETSLAVLLALGHSLVEAAKSMHVQEATARSYLKHIFLKTDANRQSELVGTLLRSCMPTAGPGPDLARPPK
jgi:DNA-binding CsgD family transcriptional regulator/PAS domain-containing protein